MQTRYSEENSVCLSVRPYVRPSVRPSVTRVHCDKTVERSVQISIPYERTFMSLFWEEEWLVGGDPFYVKFWLNRPHWNEIANFQPIIARSSSAATPSERSSINANRKSTTRFPTSLRWSSYVTPKSPEGGLKNSKRPIFIKKCTLLQESLLQSFFVWKLSAAKL